MVPVTIAELEKWYKDNKLPAYDKSRFFIGEDYKGARAYGIYEANGDFIVYKNKNDGSRAIRYQGPDEKRAVNEIYVKLRQEIAAQEARPHQETNNSNNNSNNFKTENKNNKNNKNKNYKDKKKKTKSNNKSKRNHRNNNGAFGFFFKSMLIRCGVPFAVMIVLLIFACICAMFSEDEPVNKEGYYSYNNDTYYFRNNDWYYYNTDNEDWYETSVPEELENDGITYYDSQDSSSSGYDISTASNYENWNSEWSQADDNSYKSPEAEKDNTGSSGNSWDDNVNWDDSDNWDSDYTSDGWDSDW